MGILENYTKQTTSPLKSITIKLQENQIIALREYKVNLGALVRDMLDDSDLMQEFNQKHQITSVQKDTVKIAKSSSTDMFSEEQFQFEYAGISYYYADSKTMFEKSSDGVIKKITKHSYYKQKELAKEQ